MSICIVIPARYSSSRFPGKPLVNIKNKPMIIWVAELSEQVIDRKHIYIATDDERIKNTVLDFGYKVVMTNKYHKTGTDRLAEAAERLDYDYIINVQGDEPILNPIDIEKCIELKIKYPNYIINAYSYINNDQNPYDKNIPKVITTHNDFLIYMSRLAIPGCKDKSNKPFKFKKQICVYGFTPKELLDFRDFGKNSPIEICEDIEIIRFLEMGKRILMFEARSNTFAVDEPKDVDIIENYIDNKLNNKYLN